MGRHNALKLNFKMALRNGAQLHEIFEAIFQVAAYAGFAATWDALEKLAEVLNEDAEWREFRAKQWTGLFSLNF